MEWLTTAEAAELLGVTQRHIRWLIVQGRLVAQKWGPRDYRIRRKDVLKAKDRPEGTWPGRKKKA